MDKIQPNIDKKCEFKKDSSVLHINRRGPQQEISIFIEELKKKVTMCCPLYRDGECGHQGDPCKKDQKMKKNGFSVFANNVERSDVLRAVVGARKQDSLSRMTEVDIETAKIVAAKIDHEILVEGVEAIKDEILDAYNQVISSQTVSIGLAIGNLPKQNNKAPSSKALESIFYKIQDLLTILKD